MKGDIFDLVRRLLTIEQLDDLARQAAEQGHTLQVVDIDGSTIPATVKIKREKTVLMPLLAMSVGQRFEYTVLAGRCHVSVLTGKPIAAADLSMGCNNCLSGFSHVDLIFDPSAGLDWQDLGDDGVLCPACRTDGGPEVVRLREALQEVWSLLKQGDINAAKIQNFIDETLDFGSDPASDPVSDPVSEELVYVVDGHKDGGFYRYERYGDTCVKCYSTRARARQYATEASRMIHSEHQKPWEIVATTFPLLRNQHGFLYADYDGTIISLDKYTTQSEEVPHVN